MPTHDEQYQADLKAYYQSPEYKQTFGYAADELIRQSVALQLAMYRAFPRRIRRLLRWAIQHKNK